MPIGIFEEHNMKDMHYYASIVMGGWHKIKVLYYVNLLKYECQYTYIWQTNKDNEPKY